MRNQLPAHERLAATAARLFYEAGITATGVDTVVRVAGVSKPTLYAHRALPWLAVTPAA